MIGIYFKQQRLMLLLFITLSIRNSQSLDICPTAVWSVNATTVAGAQSVNSSSNSSLLRSPYDVHADDYDIIYVLDRDNYRVQRYFSNSIQGTTVVNGSKGAALNQFNGMTSMSVDANGSIYILDSGNERVTKWLQGASVGEVVAGGNGQGAGENQTNGAVGMYIDLNTLIIWIADTNNHRIVKWTSPMASEVVCGSFGLADNQFNNPEGLFVDTNDSDVLYVADTNNHRIQMWSQEPLSGKTVAGITNSSGRDLNHLAFPRTLIVDTNKNMFIVDAGNDRIMRWIIGADEGIIIAGNGMAGSGSNQLFFPMGISFSSSGALFVADTSNNRIQKFSMSCVSNMTNTTPTTPIVNIIPSNKKYLMVNNPMDMYSDASTTIHPIAPKPDTTVQMYQSSMVSKPSLAMVFTSISPAKGLSSSSMASNGPTPSMRMITAAILSSYPSMVSNSPSMSRVPPFSNTPITLYQSITSSLSRKPTVTMMVTGMLWSSNSYSMLNSTKMSTTTKKSLGSVDYYPKWSLIFFISLSLFN